MRASSGSAGSRQVYLSQKDFPVSSDWFLIRCLIIQEKQKHGNCPAAEKFYYKFIKKVLTNEILYVIMMSQRKRIRPTEAGGDRLAGGFP
jgi:hypothetical protein